MPEPELAPDAIQQLKKECAMLYRLVTVALNKITVLQEEVRLLKGEKK